MQFMVKTNSQLDNQLAATPPVANQIDTKQATLWPSSYANMLRHKSHQWTSKPDAPMNFADDQVAASLLLAEKVNASWSGDWGRSVSRGVVAGLTVPVITLPLVQMETKITISRGFKVAWQSTLERPWLGYRVSVLTNATRTSILYGLSSDINERLQPFQFGPTATKAYACTVAAVTEGAIMSFKTPLMQKLHTSDDRSYSKILVRSARPEFVKAWRVACVLGVARDASFWPLWALTVDQMEKKLLVHKQQETAIKWWEQFMIGASAGALVAPLSFPIHGVMRRLIDDKCVASNPFVGIKNDLSKLWSVHKSAGLPAWSYIPKQIYKGFGPSLFVIAASMGGTNFAKHVADVVYDRYKACTLFGKTHSFVSEEKLEDRDAILSKMI
jgi:hypothetical protein